MTTSDKNSNHEDIGWLSASDVMQRDIVSVRDSDTIDEVERIIADASIGGVPVIAADGKVLGVISTSDLVSRRADGEDPAGMPLESVDDDGNDVVIETGTPDGAELRAGDVMTPGAVTVKPDTNLRTVARRMIDSSVHRLLVVRDERLEGIVSTFDILRALAGDER